jgi:hypothetical protein
LGLIKHFPVTTTNNHKAMDKSVRLIILVRIIPRVIYRQIKDIGFLPSNGARNAC